MAEQTFKVGDKVQHSIAGDGEITYGPFDGLADPCMFLMRVADGKEHIVRAHALTALPAFAVGDKVEYTLGTPHIRGTLVAGPFTSEYHDEPIWVVEKANGTHMTPTQNALRKVVNEPVKVGDRVRVVEDDPEIATGRYVGMVGTVDELNRLTYRPELKYRIKFDDGDTWNVAEVEKFTDAPAADTFEYGGLTYEFGAKYKDKDGDVWAFRRPTSEDQDDRTYSYSNSDVAFTDDRSFAWGCCVGFVADSYGPLRKI